MILSLALLRAERLRGFSYRPGDEDTCVSSRLMRVGEGKEGRDRLVLVLPDLSRFGVAFLVGKDVGDFDARNPAPLDDGTFTSTRCTRFARGSEDSPSSFRLFRIPFEIASSHLEKR